MTESLKAFDGASNRQDDIDLSKYFQNVTDCLDNYRALKLYTEHALDKITLDLQAAQSRFKVDATLYSTARAKVTTAAIIELIDRQMSIYHQLCVLYGAERRFSIVRLKFFDLPGKGDEKDQPYTTLELADYFDCSADTIKRELKLARAELKILFFGASKMRPIC